MEKVYDIFEASSGQEAKEVIEDVGTAVSLVILEPSLPKVEGDGFYFLEYLSNRQLLDKIPVIIISKEDSSELEAKCLAAGASDYIPKPFSLEVLVRRIKIIIDLFEKKSQLELNLIRQTREVKKQYKLMEEQASKMAESKERIVDLLGEIVEYRNYESGDHILNVKNISQAIAAEAMASYKEFELNPEIVSNIVSASALHDFGKIAISDTILMKPGRLTEDEFDLMKSHTYRGAEMIGAIEGVWTDEFKEIAIDIARYHHERYDGKGYPEGLKGEKIPISAQIVSIAEAYDALVSETVYKKAYPLDQAFNMIISGQCGQFNPKLMECFRKLRPTIEAMYNKGK